MDSTTRNLRVQDACFEDKKAEETSPSKSTPRTLKKVGQQYPLLREHQPLFLSNAIVHRGGETKDLPDGKPRMVTTAVVPIRNGRCGSCSSSRTRTWNLLARRTQFSVCCTSGSTPTVAPS